MKRRPNLWLGHRREHEGRSFVVWRVRRHRARAGHVVPVLCWRAACAEPSCGLPFEFETSRKPRPFDPPTRCALHRESRAERRALRRRAAILDSLVAELPDGRLVAMSGDPVERDPRPDAGCEAWT